MKMGFKNIIRDYFTFNKRERNGVFILLSIIIILILYLSFSGYFFPKEKTDFSKFEKEISQFEAQQKQISDSVSGQRENYFLSGNTPEPDNAERFQFNPNNLPVEDWKRLGLSDKQIHTIKNYESKGGKFRTKEDVKKMYCITPQLYASLEPYIQIPDSDKKLTTYQSTQHALPPLSPRRGAGGEAIELNSADTSSLKTLKGIGSVFAKRIVKFRDLLGGFVKKDQLLEVYGFDQEKFDLVSPQVTLDISTVKKMNINSASVDDLRKHPYMNKKAAVIIYTHRVNNGDFKDVQEIKELNFVGEELYNKLAPYLKVE
jgi:DNA uptake protein ComE-like DNA-binding protein